MGEDKINRNIDICAGWEDRGDGHFRCRWFLAWVSFEQGETKNNDNQVWVGYYAGYSGGGSYEVEQFKAEIANSQLQSLFVEPWDLVSSEEIDWSESINEDEKLECLKADDQLWMWNIWKDDDSVWLKQESELELHNKLIRKDDMLYFNSRNFESDEISMIREICSLGGLTAGPMN
jgi:hypothetical protein